MNIRVYTPPLNCGEGGKLELSPGDGRLAMLGERAGGPASVVPVCDGSKNFSASKDLECFYVQRAMRAHDSRGDGVNDVILTAKR